MLINILIVTISILGVVDILFRNNGVNKSIKWIVVAFVFGYRTIEFYGVGIHPIEVFAYSAILRIIVAKDKKQFQLPLGIVVLAIFFIIYFFIDLITRYNENVLLEFKSTFMLIIIFFLIQYAWVNKEYFFSILRYYLTSVSIIASLGILEFLYPNLMSMIFGFENYRVVNIDNQFVRVKFLFWGAHIAANLIAPSFPIMMLLRERNDSYLKNNYVLTILFMVNLIAIYLSGNRISWLILTIMLIMIIIAYHNSLIPFFKSYALVLVTLFIAYVYSQPVKGRYFSTFKAITGQVDSKYDSSGNVRLSRAKTAFKSIKENQVGTGWGSQGWVHSDVLQVASSIGIIPGLIFFISPILLSLNLFRYYRQAPQDDKTIFFASFLIILYIIISQVFNGNYVLIQCGAPLAMFWALIQSYLNQYKYKIV